jgi:mRNA interferase YafQ
VRTPVYTGQFRRDVKRAWRRGKDMAKLRDAIDRLVAGERLPPRFNDHPLVGQWSSYRDCHIEPDWLLIYKIDGDELILARTGSHADLFRSG